MKSLVLLAGLTLNLPLVCNIVIVLRRHPLHEPILRKLTLSFEIIQKIKNDTIIGEKPDNFV